MGKREHKGGIVPQRFFCGGKRYAGYGLRMTLYGVTGASPAPMLSGLHPTGKPESGGTVQRGSGSNAEDRRRTEHTANHDGGCGCPQKRKRIMQGSAGWPNNNYWTGELNDVNNAYNVNIDNGSNDNNGNLNNSNSVVCRR